MPHNVPLRVLLLERGSLAAALVAMARSRKKEGIRLLKKPRHLETTSLVLKEAAGQPLRLARPPLAVEDRGPLLPPTASRAVTVGATTSWTGTLGVRLPGLGTVRRGVRCPSAALTGPSVVVVTQRVDGGAQRIIALSLQRWPIETVYQDGTTPLGVDE